MLHVVAKTINTKWCSCICFQIYHCILHVTIMCPLFMFTSNPPTENIQINVKLIISLALLIDLCGGVQQICNRSLTCCELQLFPDDWHTVILSAISHDITKMLPKKVETDCRQSSSIIVMWSSLHPVNLSEVSEQNPSNTQTLHPSTLPPSLDLMQLDTGLTQGE